jgi:hypothetical protein
MHPRTYRIPAPQPTEDFLRSDSVGKAKAGPGSYEVPSSLASISQLYYNFPQICFPKAVKTDKIRDRGVPHGTYYSPDSSAVLRKYHSPKFELYKARSSSIFAQNSMCSPGPIYKYDLLHRKSPSVKGTFSQSTRSFITAKDKVSPDLYSPHLLKTSQVTTISSRHSPKKLYLENTESFLLARASPGPAAYSPSQNSSVMKAGFSKVSRDSAPLHAKNPGPGQYSIPQRSCWRMGKFNSGRRKFDTRKSKAYAVAVAYEMNRYESSK